MVLQLPTVLVQGKSVLINILHVGVYSTQIMGLHEYIDKMCLTLGVK